MSKAVVFIPKAGGCIASKNIMNHIGKLKWCIREEPTNPADNGWRFFSDVDTDEYLSHAENLAVYDFNTVANEEPAILAIYDFPVGSDLQLVEENGKKTFWNNETEERIQFN